MTSERPNQTLQQTEVPRRNQQSNEGSKDGQHHDARLYQRYEIGQ